MARLLPYMARNEETRKTHGSNWSLLARINPKEDKLDLDELDLQVIRALIEGGTSADISKQLNKPLSTIQRRVRKIEEKRFVSRKAQPNFAAFGFKRGIIGMTISTGDQIQICDKLLALDGIISASAYLGSTDVTALAIYRSSRQALQIINKVKLVEGVAEVNWSEEVYSTSK